MPGDGPSLSVVTGSARYFFPILYAGAEACFIYYNSEN